MTFSDVAMEARPIIDTQYTVDAANDSADDTPNNRPKGSSIVLTDASAMVSTIWYALSVRSGRYCERHDTNNYDIPVHIYL